ncbi:hypothetical protein R3P38DRAFT_3366740 [Favolaschia claudopus]|uniref:Uncharacterized protein n=1 Tax=Favolaschia claudopus TaxID=2862362 RepID=A0AAW0ACH3_9AGAR
MVGGKGGAWRSRHIKRYYLTENETTLGKRREHPEVPGLVKLGQAVKLIKPDHRFRYPVTTWELVYEIYESSLPGSMAQAAAFQAQQALVKMFRPASSAPFDSIRIQKRKFGETWLPIMATVTLTPGLVALPKVGHGVTVLWLVASVQVSTPSSVEGGAGDKEDCSSGEASRVRALEETNQEPRISPPADNKPFLRISLECFTGFGGNWHWRIAAAMMLEEYT